MPLSPLTVTSVALRFYARGEYFFRRTALLHPEQSTNSSFGPEAMSLWGYFRKALCESVELY